MADDDQDDIIEREARAQQGFSVAAVIGREGGSMFKGETIVPAVMQATNKLLVFIDAKLPDSSGALRTVMRQRLKSCQSTVAEHLDEPLDALLEIIGPVITNEQHLVEFVRQVDFEWGQIMCERPHFQQLGQEAHPDDEHTHESVKDALLVLRKAVEDYKATAAGR